MSNELTKYKKDNSVDILKGIAILAVIFGHIASPLTNFIFSWHMPLFFFISGFFIKTEDNFKIFFLKNFKKIMIYFFIFAIIGFLVTYFKDIFLNRENESLKDGITGIFFWMDMEHLRNYGFILWFLPALFWGKCINYLLIKNLKNNLAIGLILLSIFYFIIQSKIKLPFVIDIGLISSIWIFLGFIFYNFLYKKIVCYQNYILIIIPLIIFFIPLPILNISQRYFSDPIYNLIYSILIVIFLFIFTKKSTNQNTKYNLLAYLGQNSMFLFVLHPYTNNIVYILVYKFFNNIWYIKYVLSFVLIYFILRIFRKYINKEILRHV
jgi:acyltransferase